MIFVRPRSGGQVLFTGVLLCLLMLLWMRAAVIIYALFFGLRPFPGLEHIAPMLFTTPIGWAMLLVGGVVGGLFAAFSFAISVFSIPMLLERARRCVHGDGNEHGLVWNNLPAMLTWGAIVLALFLVEPRDRAARPDRRVSRARPWHLARLPRDSRLTRLERLSLQRQCGNRRMSCCTSSLDLAAADRRRRAQEELLLASRVIGEGLRQTDLSVPGIHCGGCIRTIEQALGALPGVEQARVNLSTKRVDDPLARRCGRRRSSRR